MSEITVERDVMVEMRDGVALATDVYRPDDDGSYPTLVHRNPYNKSNGGSVAGLMVNPLDAVQDGFAVVVQDVRGRFASEGEWEPFVNEEADGYDTVEWAAAQPWSTGRVGVYGSSYHGVTAWLAAVADPPHLEAALPYLTGSNYHDGWTYTGGAFELGFNLWWTTYLAGDTVGRLDVPVAERERALADLKAVASDPQGTAEQLPVRENDLFTSPAATYAQHWFDNAAYDSYWADVDVVARADEISVPVLHISGWYDQFLPGHLDAFEALAAQGGRVAEGQRMIVGPWDHEAYATLTPDMAGERAFGPEAVGGRTFVSDRLLTWFGHWLDDRPMDDRPAVEYFEMGADEWKESAQWPPDHTPTEYYLHSGGSANGRSGDGVLRTTPPGNQPPDSYSYDPLDPVPSCGGRSVMLNMAPAGVQDRSAVEAREDVLVYTGPRLTKPVHIAGSVSATLHAASSARDTDFVVTLVDVEPDGYALPVASGIQRARYRDSRRRARFLEPGAVTSIEVDMSGVAHAFRAGHRIRLEVTSSDFPRFDRNLNVETPPAAASRDEATTAVQHLHHDTDHPSHVTLPVR